jgi:hypothetical protein
MSCMTATWWSSVSIIRDWRFPWVRCSGWLASPHRVRKNLIFFSGRYDTVNRLGQPGHFGGIANGDD